MKNQIILVMLLSILLLHNISCKTEETQAASANMTFTDNPDKSGKEFQIDENLKFKVKFNAAFFNSLECHVCDANCDADCGLVCDGKCEDGCILIKSIYESFGIVPNRTIFGCISETENKWTDNVINGTAGEMSSNDKELTDLLKAMKFSCGVKLTYEKGDNDKIIAVSVEVTSVDMAGIKQIADMMIGGTYYRIK